MARKAKSNGVGRPSTYTSTIAAEICRRIAEGEPLVKICRDSAIPAYRTVLGWRVTNDEFAQLYARAREDAADTLADRICELAERVEKGELEAHAGRTAIDALKWVASKLKPRIYGERAHLEVSGGLKVETVKDHAPEWLQEMLAELAPAAITAGDEDEDTIH